MSLLEVKQNIHIQILDESYTDEIVNLLCILNPHLTRETLQLRLNQSSRESCRYVGAFSEERLLGICGFSRLTKIFCGSSLFLENFVVYPEYRNQQVGTALLTFFKTYMKKNNIDVLELDCYLENELAIKFYQSQGFYSRGFHMIYNEKEF